MFSKTLLALVVAASLFGPALAQNAPPGGDAVWPYLAAMQSPQRLDVMIREAKREGQLSIYSAIGIDRRSTEMRPIFSEIAGFAGVFASSS